MNERTKPSMDAIVDVELRKREQKDVELDKKILALRKKNEALIKRYQEIEEDKRNAEQEGMAVTSRKQKQDSLTITITKAPNEKRIVSEKYVNSCLSGPGFPEEDEEIDNMLTLQMGKRMQLAITMDNGKRIVSEKWNSECLPSPKEIPALTAEDVDKLFTFGRGRRMQIAISMNNKAKESEKLRQKSTDDLTLTTTGRERLNYIQWKKEREQIDLERLARHKNSKGEWRRPWDAEKTGNMFKGRPTNEGEPVLDGLISKRGQQVLEGF
ncbi:coiled-coil domain-containing protein 9B-like isoform X3 [Rhinatrema bivittatum]|uniref:coiled-coil domain-containing protein 9B-like isoform X3 n=1 Tax=Rhinatrema bivittatum TaxID=194408 RepID=UPI00112EECEA|nr:coiled-coil domain-containing protein 9B-like isoform X3 [Rhinatrema bivittatum]